MSETPKIRTADDKTTPAMAQFFAFKARYPECLLFFRMGDFYELFFDDAVAAAKALGITLTQRGSHAGEPIAMCGVPFHAVDQYLPRLIRAGFHVAVCEQMEDPAQAKARGNKSVVRRDVVRVVTPGTLTEDSLLDARRNNYLAAVGSAGGAQALAWLDMSTGELSVALLGDDEALAAQIARVDPRELLLSADAPTLPEQVGSLPVTRQPKALFSSSEGERALRSAYGVTSLDAFGKFDRAELSALGALLAYIEITQLGALPRLRPIQQQLDRSVMGIDAATFRNLAIVRGADNTRDGSLLSALDETVSPSGGRLLAARLSAPSTDKAIIDRRLDAVSWFLEAGEARAGLRALLKGFGDIERGLQRLSLDRGGPRDLAMIRDSLAQATKLRLALAGAALPEAVECACAQLDHDGSLHELLGEALNDQPPMLARDGGFIRQGFRPDIDEQLTLRNEARRLIAALEARYAQETGVTSLKIKYNKVLGYTVEVTAQNASKLPSAAGEQFIHRQTLKNAVRYTTTELADLEANITGAADRLLLLELAQYDDLRAQTLAAQAMLSGVAQAVAEIDLATSLAELAQDRDWVRPSLHEDLRFEIDGGRHPVVERALQADGARFVANSCALSEEDRLWLLTGPNMAGKSTFLRQNALIAVLAQMGSYVPADRAAIGIVDRLFSRVGASDDLVRGRSTFMVEMVETATILTQATERSFVILDEIGRGTATYDGLSIAWATAEYLHDVNRARAIFATHYHELTKLTERLESVSAHAMKVKEVNDEILFLHDVIAGAADRSYGVHVAKLAGLPAPVVSRAREVLEGLERGGENDPKASLETLPLFAPRARVASSPTAERPEPSALALRIASEDLDALTPRDALNLLYQLRELAENEATNS